MICWEVMLGYVKSYMLNVICYEFNEKITKN